MNNSIALTLTLISSSFNSGSMSWKPGWLQFEKPSKKGDISELLKKANHMIQSADTREKVLELLETYEHALKIDPRNREALQGATLYSFLIAIGYSDKKDEKRTYYLNSINHCEQFMYLNHEFADLVDKGENSWEACRVLSKTDLEVLFFWAMGVGCIWKDCLSGLGKILNLNIAPRCKKMLKTMMEIDPTWGCGTPYYAWANYYANTPRLVGGDMKKAEEYYRKAIEMGPDMLNFRRTRALLLHVKNKDRTAFKEDLNWVLSQDPKKERDYLSYPYSVFLQREVRDMLGHIDSYF
jgi:tetratricopeptide (TPR) repeat protein